MSLARWAFVIAIVPFAGSMSWSGPQVVQEDASPVVLARFKIARHGESLLLPVAFNGKTYLFALDTGSERSAYDLTFPLGAPDQTIKANTPGGSVDVQLFAAPNAKIGNLDFAPGGLILGIDLEPMRKATGEAIYGIIGMDFLERRVVQIDFDKGELAFLRDATTATGARQRLRYMPSAPTRATETKFLFFTFRYRASGGGSGPTRHPCPCIDLDLGDERATRFLLDTGFHGADSGSIKQILVTSLEKKGAYRVVGRDRSLSLGGDKSIRIVQGKKLILDNFAIADPIFSEGNENSVGLGFLARFKATFDFQDHMLYLEKGQEFARPDSWNRSGLHFHRADGKPVAAFVDRDSAGAKAGIQPGDVICMVGKRKADEVSNADLRRLFSQPGIVVNLTLERNGKSFEAIVKLEK